jgi:phosphohistidine phosphatase
MTAARKSRVKVQETDDEIEDLTGCTLYIVRHALAGVRGDEWPDDDKRPVTRKGAAKMRQTIRGVDALGVRIDLVLTSPLVRARQTADILVDGLDPRPKLAVSQVLAPDHPPAAVAAALGAHKGCRAIALVGHEPDLGVLAAWLIGAREPLPFKKGGVCRIDVPGLPPAQDGQLRWFATPRMLRGLA